uniref:Uncharacterized protein n=1 Tax=Trypanosoma congolense (strain IL3000) TaxID=1068625 RepID=F9W9S6_TRYCI|nr:hypothetical protein, unlikely [Trypanosoma congolense IL3000]
MFFLEGRPLPSPVLLRAWRPGSLFHFSMLGAVVAPRSVFPPHVGRGVFRDEHLWRCFGGAELRFLASNAPSTCAYLLCRMLAGGGGERFDTPMSHGSSSCDRQRLEIPYRTLRSVAYVGLRGGG